MRVALSKLGGAEKPRQEATRRFDTIGFLAGSRGSWGSDLRAYGRASAQAPSSIHDASNVRCLSPRQLLDR